MKKIQVDKKIKIPGFLFSGIHAGMKDDKNKKDLALIYSEEPKTLIDGVFTKNLVKAPPVEICQNNLKKTSTGRVIAINSGIANACTGKDGLKRALQTQKEISKILKIKQEEAFVCSTGKIGGPLPMTKMLPGLKKASQKLDPQNFHQVSEAIMTTDQYPKFSSCEGKIGKEKYTIAVMAKGAGMLHPNMATMLAFIVTDLKFTKSALHTLFRQAVNETLNRVTVDGDTSTNDTVLIMANGRAGNKTFKANDSVGQKVKKQMVTLLENMSRQIAMDGEGATTCCDVIVEGARSEKEAEKVAYAIGQSLLVKTALFGRDPNWGRIMAAIGYSGAKIQPEKVSIKMGSLLLVKNGMGVEKNLKKVADYMNQEFITMKVNLAQGKSRYHVYMSDLTYDYIHLNAEYHT